ncbi:MAG: hypothetical protein R3314_08795 [Longimicrobiales bacterium]|nr:hypothetical protein [Longimicrobiales bacterium]
MNQRFGIALTPLAVAIFASTAVAPESSPPEYTVRATDYAFEAPAEVPAGPATFRLVNEGSELHHAVLVRLGDGHTADELKEHLVAQDVRAPGQPELPTWATLLGGPNATRPGGGEAVATVPLRPGSYAWICVVHSPKDGVPHYEQGMIEGMEVTPGQRADLPDADMLMRLTDYDFDLSDPLTPGTHTIRVRNYAAQPHEVVIFKLAPDRTPQDLEHYMEALLNPGTPVPEGPPPAAPVGGVSPIAQGEANNMTLQVSPGTYVLLCVLPDAGDGRLHVAHGMRKVITVETSAGSADSGAGWTGAE